MVEASMNYIDPKEVKKSYVALRTYLINECENKNEIGLVQPKIKWRDLRPKNSDKFFQDKLGLTPEKVEAWLAEKSRAYHEYFASQIEPIFAQEKHLDWEPGPVDSDMLNPLRRQPIPYATLVVSSNPDLMTNVPPDAEMHNPWYQLQKTPSRQEIHIDRRGQGSGLYDWSLIPDYNSVDYKNIYWIYLYVPSREFGAATAWFAYAKLLGIGEWDCWADDEWYNSLFARILLRLKVYLQPLYYSSPFPLGGPIAPEIRRLETTIFDVGGQNIDWHRWGGFLRELGPLDPNPWQMLEPHWIVVNAYAECQWRGTSWANIDFKNGWVSSGSKESGTYKRDQYGIYCYDVSVYQGPTEVRVRAPPSSTQPTGTSEWHGPN